MTKGRLFLMLVISLAMAIGAALVAQSWLQERMEPRTSTDPATATVVVAASDIRFGKSIDAAQLRLAEYPVDLAPSASFSRIDEVVGKVAVQAIYPDEVVTEQRIAENDEGSSLAAVLEKGKRAVTVRVNDVLGVAGFLLPGNRVDVVATKRSSNRSGDIASKTILTDIQVLAVDQLASQDSDDPMIARAVTLAVKPEQAEELVKATQEGQVQLTLRNPFEEPVPLVASEPEPKVEPKPRPVYRRPRLYDVEVIRGTATSSQKVND